MSEIVWFLSFSDWLISPSIILSPFMLLQMARFHYFLCPGNIPLYVYYIFLIHSSIVGHLGCFHFLAIINDAAITIGVHVSLWISLFVYLGKYPVVKLLNHRIVLFLTFWGISILFSTVAAPVRILINSTWGFLFLYFLSNDCCFSCFLF